MSLDEKPFNKHYQFLGEQGMLDEAQRALEEAEALKKVHHFLIHLCILFQILPVFL